MTITQATNHRWIYDIPANGIKIKKCRKCNKLIKKGKQVSNGRGNRRYYHLKCYEELYQ